jgi:hypothetical protein
MAFIVGSGQSRDTDVQNLSRRFTDDGMPYMYGSYKDVNQFGRSGGDDYQTGTTPTKSWRTYVPDWPTSLAGYDTVADQGNPTNFGFMPYNSGSFTRGGQFVAAAGKLFIGAPNTYADAHDIGNTTFLTGCVFVCHPHRIRTSSLPHSTEFPCAVNSGYDSYGIYGRRSGRSNGNAFEVLWPAGNIHSGGGHPNKYYYGAALAYGSGKLFVSYPFSERTISSVTYTNIGGIRIYRGNTNTDDMLSTTIGTYQRPGSIFSATSGPSDLGTNSFFGITMDAGCGKICVGDYNGNVYVKGITDGDDDFPRESYDNGTYANAWKKITGPQDDFGNLHPTTLYGNNIKVGCGRIAVGAPYAHVLGSGGGEISDAGMIYLYDLNGNIIRKMYPPNPITNGYFGAQIDIGSGRIVSIDRGSNSVAIYDLDGELIALRNNTPFAYNLSGTASSIAVGFGRILVALPSWDDGANSDEGIIWGYDLDGNYLGQMKNGGGSSGNGYSYADMGLGGIEITPGRMYTIATKYSASGTIPSMIHETPIHTIMTPWDVQALEDGDK